MNNINLTYTELNELLSKVSIYFKDITLSSNGNLKAKVNYEQGTRKQAVTETCAVLLDLGFGQSKVSAIKDKGVLEIVANYTKKK